MFSSKTAVVTVVTGPVYLVVPVVRSLMCSVTPVVTGPVCSIVPVVTYLVCSVVTVVTSLVCSLVTSLVCSEVTVETGSVCLIVVSVVPSSVLVFCAVCFPVDPAQPSGLEITPDVSLSSGLLIKWLRPPGHVEGYELVLLDSRMNVVKKQKISGSAVTRSSFTNLIPGTHYTLHLVAISGNKTSLAATGIAVTGRTLSLSLLFLSLACLSFLV